MLSGDYEYDLRPLRERKAHLGTLHNEGNFRTEPREEVAHVSMLG